LRYDDLLKLGAVMSKAKPFVSCVDWSPAKLGDSDKLRQRFQPAPKQLSLF
jgi:predicted DNA-binding helix-hairpin-helix protein